MAKYVDKVIVATTTNSSDDCIAQWCEAENVPYFRGSETDVLDRYYQTARHFQLDLIVRITSDCPFIDPAILDMLILYSHNFEYDDVVNRWKTRTWPHGLDAEIFTFSALERAWVEGKDSYEREHVTPYILRHPEIFSIFEVPYKEDISNIRLTVDYTEDVEFVKKVMPILIKEFGIEFTWKQLLSLLGNNPELTMINQNRVDTRL